MIAYNEYDVDHGRPAGHEHKDPDIMEGMAKTPTRLTEKLRRLCKGRQQNELAAEIGVSPSQIGQYLAGSIPGPGVLLRLSNALGVPIQWLADDRQGMKPPKSSAVLIGDTDLMAETARRYAEEAARLADSISRAEKIDWDEVGKAFGAGPPFRPDVEAAIEVAQALYFLVKFTVDYFDSVIVAKKLFQADVAGKGDPTNSARRQHFVDRIDGIYDRLTAPDGASRAFMSRLQGSVFLLERDAIVERMEGTLTEYEQVVKNSS